MLNECWTSRLSGIPKFILRNTVMNCTDNTDIVQKYLTIMHYYECNIHKYKRLGCVYDFGT